MDVSGEYICGLVISVFLHKDLPSVHCFIERFLICSVTLVTDRTCVTEMLKKTPKYNIVANNTSVMEPFYNNQFCPLNGECSFCSCSCLNSVSTEERAPGPSYFL